jgi:hypothetical protein
MSLLLNSAPAKAGAQDIGHSAWAPGLLLSQENGRERIND